MSGAAGGVFGLRWLVFVVPMLGLGAAGCHQSHELVTLTAPDGSLGTTGLDAGVVDSACGSTLTVIRPARRTGCMTFEVDVPESATQTCTVIAEGRPPRGALLGVELRPGETIDLTLRPLRTSAGGTACPAGLRCAFIGEVLPDCERCGAFGSGDISRISESWTAVRSDNQPLILLGRGVVYEGEICFRS